MRSKGPRDPREMGVCAIRQKSSGYWWGCSVEHGTGWSKRIRQAWTLRESTEEALRIVAHGWARAEGLEVLELGPLPEDI